MRTVGTRVRRAGCKKIDPRAEAWTTTVLRVRGRATAIFLWDHVFGPVEHVALGGDFDTAYKKGGTVGMWQRVRGGSYQRAVLDVAEAVNLIDAPTARWLRAELGLDEVEAAFQEAVREGGLVLVDFPRQAFWGGNSIPLDWVRSNCEWEFLWLLARHSKRKLPLGPDQFEGVSGVAVVSKKQSRLVALDGGFPSDLDDLIVKAGTGQVRLALEPGQIRVFERVVGDDLREWVG